MEELWAQILDMATEVTVPMLYHTVVGFQYQLDMCCVTWGAQIEHF